jgi:zinc transporter 9
MSSSVSLSIATNTAIALSKGFGWFVTGSPTLFAETVHSIADVGNQLLLKTGEIRGRAGPDRLHPFGRGQEKYFWSLVSAVSVFFIGCAVNIYHGAHALIYPADVQPFSALVVGLLFFALALETWTFVVAWRELGGIAGLRDAHANVTVLAVLLEDTVALIGIVLTLIVAGVSLIFEPRPIFDATVAIAVGVMLGVMAVFLAGINRKLLIDSSDLDVDRAAQDWLSAQGLRARVQSLIVDDDRVVLFVAASHEIANSPSIGDALQKHLESAIGTNVEAVYWRFRDERA